MIRRISWLLFGSSFVTAAGLWAGSNEALGQEAVAGALEEIVVTARRREESLMDTPVSITAFTGTDLAARQIDQMHQIAEATPGLVFTRQSGGTDFGSRIWIRGVGQEDHVPTKQPGVGLYVDGVYVAQWAGSLIEVVDIETVEVLRGPQGTLFGRNTIGGAVQVSTVKPGNEFDADVEVRAGTRNLARIKGQVNIPFTDRFYGKFSALIQEKKGYINIPNSPNADEKGGGDNIDVARVALRWVPTDSLTIDLTGDYIHQQSKGIPTVLGSTVNSVMIGGGTRAYNYNTRVAPGLGVPLFDDRFYLGPETYTSFTSDDNRQEMDGQAANLTLQWDFGDNLSFESISSYRGVKIEGRTDTDQSPLFVFNGGQDWDGSQSSQEFQLSGVAFDDRMQWVTGIYYFRENVLHLDPVNFPTFQLISGSNVDNVSKAVYGQFTYDISDRLNLTVGGRYTDEDLDSIANDKHSYIIGWFCPRGGPPPAAASCRAQGPGFTGYAPVPDPPAPGSFRILPNNETFSSDEEQFEPHVNLAYDLTDSLLGYVSYSEGFKGGGFTQRIPPGRLIESFKPEFAEVYEIGAKWQGDRVRLTGAIFYNDYTELQVQTNRLLGGTTENASDAVIKGGEFEVLAAVTDRFTISLGWSYLDGKYKNVDPAVAFPATNQIPFVTDWQRNASASYALPLSGGELIARLDYYFSDGYFSEADNQPEHFYPDYSLWNGSLTYVHSSERWEVGVQGRNITDAYYKLHGSQAFNNHGWVQHYVGPPAEWSARYAYRF